MFKLLHKNRCPLTHVLPTWRIVIPSNPLVVYSRPNVEFAYEAPTLSLRTKPQRWVCVRSPNLSLRMLELWCVGALRFCGDFLAGNFPNFGRAVTQKFVTSRIMPAFAKSDLNSLKKRKNARADVTVKLFRVRWPQLFLGQSAWAWLGADTLGMLAESLVPIFCSVPVSTKNRDSATFKKKRGGRGL